MKLNYKDFNKMNDKELRSLPGVGRTTAKRIVSFRPFRSNEDLFKVKGLGKKTLKEMGIEKIKKKKRNGILLMVLITQIMLLLKISDMEL